MDFSLEFYESPDGASPVQDFLDELKASDSGDFAAILAGLAKLRSRQFHREPLSKAIGDQYARALIFCKRPANHSSAWNPQQRSDHTATRSGNSPLSNARMAETEKIMKKTNFDRYLETQMKDQAFARRFARAGQAWDVAVQIASLRKQAGLSQKDLAMALKTSQQQVSRLESPSYEGHSLSMLRRVADVLHSRVHIVFEPVTKKQTGSHAAEAAAPYSAARQLAKHSKQGRRP